MCSKCFREQQKRETTPISAPVESTTTEESVENVNADMVELVAEVASELKADKADPASAAGLDLNAEVKPAPTAVAEPATSAASTEVTEEPTKRRVQKNTSRCFSCKKKIGLLGFKCQCEYVFCSEHRYTDKHDCDYDWRTRAQEHLSKANPVVKAEKVQKI